MQVCDAFDLQPRGSSGEHSAAVGAKWDISNKQRIGKTLCFLLELLLDHSTNLINHKQLTSIFVWGNS